MGQFVFSVIFLFFMWVALSFITMGVGAVVLPIAYYLLVFRGSQQRATKRSAKLSSVLMQNEESLGHAIQSRPFALLIRRYLIAITNSRIVLVKPKLLGGFVMEDIQWKDLRDAQLSENVMPNFFGSNLTFKYITSQKAGGIPAVISINGIPSKLALQIYSESQAREQEWEEKRRVRGMEETRAAAGGVIVHTAHAGEPSTAKKSDSSVIKEIEKAKKLLDAGTISDSEFQEIKSKILSGIHQF